MLILLWFSVISVHLAQAQEIERSHKNLLDTVFRELKTNVRALQTCAYTQQTTITDVGSMQERFDPNIGLGLEWQLLQVNGQDPTDKQLNDYEPKPRKRHPAVLNFDFIDTDSLKFLDQSQSRLNFSYTVAPEISNDQRQFVSHQLTLDAETRQLLELKSFATESFRIQPWMHIQEYKSVSTFRFEEQINSSVLETVRFILKAKSGKRTIEREITKQFSNLVCADPSADLEPIDLDRDQLNDNLDALVPRAETPNPLDPTNR